MKRLAAILTAFGTALFCGVRVSAADGQRIVTLPAGGPYRLNAQALEKQIGSFDALTFTFTPQDGCAVLFYEGAPLAPYRTLTREQVEKVMVFACEPAVAGAAPFSLVPHQNRPQLRVRCINPIFSGQTIDEKS
ncbi:hypothetical protein [Anaerotruncus colihominis]|uniref:hypothetical protein n=1 Tax=Anaerotruncus colihominis TaxID=169435 RepID=UPI001897C81D|nr:hypothetical protein [Anaerotruncus colihominis]